LSTVLDVHSAQVVIAGRPVLHDVDLSVPTGQFVALMGANGSGKSTLVRAATGLRPLSAGRVELFGTPLPRFREWHRVGFVPQRAGAASGVPVSVREVVASGRLGRRRLLAPLSRADRRAVADALEVVGLTGRASESVATLSGGQQQRVLIARALAGDPEVFFLDEPTAGVDLVHQEALAGSLGVLKERGATIVLVAHELGPMAPLVDRAVVLAHGRVAHDGLPLDEVAEPHHHDAEERHDHTPHVGSPIDTLQERR
jgi:zinc transport system ATP-binding protein